MVEHDLIDLNPVNLRGLAHPMRVRLLTLLREDGPSTATRLASRLGVSSGAASYHLRQLAAYGFVKDDSSRGVGRERWWCAAHSKTMLTADVGREALPEAEGYLRAVAMTDFQRVDAFLSELPTVPGEWDDSWTVSSARLRLTVDEAAELRRRIEAVIAHYARPESRGTPAGDTHWVVAQWQTFPLLGED